MTDIVTDENHVHPGDIVGFHTDLIADLHQIILDRSDRFPFFHFGGVVGCGIRSGGLITAKKRFRLFLGIFLFLGGRIDCGGVVGFLLFSAQYVVDNGNRAFELCRLTQELEFQLGGSADHFLCRPFIFQTGKFDDNAVLSLFLDDRFGDAECVDTVFYNGIGAVENVLVGFFFEVGPVYFEYQTHSALQVETEVEDFPEYPRVLHYVRLPFLR